MINDEGCVDAAHSISIFIVFQNLILWMTEHSHTLKATLPLWSYLTPYLGDLQLSLYFPKSWPGWRDTSTKRSRHISLYTDKQCHQAQMWCYQQKEFAPSLESLTPPTSTSSMVMVINLSRMRATFCLLFSSECLQNLQKFHNHSDKNETYLHNFKINYWYYYFNNDCPPTSSNNVCTQAFTW